MSKSCTELVAMVSCVVHHRLQPLQRRQEEEVGEVGEVGKEQERMTPLTHLNLT